MAETVTYVGLDVYEETIAVALAAAGERGEVLEYGTIATTPTALKTLDAVRE
jgi:transposase